MSYDLTQVPDSEFINEAGEFPVKIVKVEAGIISQAKGTPGFRITLSTEDGRTIKDTLWETKDAMFRIKLLAKACKLPESEMAVFEPSMLKGLSVTITTKMDGEYAKVVKYSPADEDVNAPEPVAKDEPPF